MYFIYVQYTMYIQTTLNKKDPDFNTLKSHIMPWGQAKWCTGLLKGMKISTDMNVDYKFILCLCLIQML